MFGDVVPYMEMDHLRWCFNKIFTQNVTSKDLSCPNCLSAISEGYKDKISTWGGDVDLLKCLNGFLKKEVKVLFREISLWYCSNLSNKVKHCLHVCNTRHYCIVLLPSHCFTQHYLRFSPCHSIFTQNTAGARQLAACSYCWWLPKLVPWPLPPSTPPPPPLTSPHWPHSLSPVSYCPVPTPGRGGSFLCTHCSWPQQPHCNQELYEYEWPFLSTSNLKNAKHCAVSCLKHWDWFNAMNVKQ